MEAIRTSTTTLGCPEWELPSIVKNLSGYGFDAVDFRGLRDALDITQTPEFTTDIAETKRLFSDAGLAISCISSSIRLCAEDAVAENLDEARRTIAVAHELDVPCVRIFGGGDPEAQTRDALADAAAAMSVELLALDGARDIQWCIETHDHWVAAADMKHLLERISAENVGVVWDIGHTTRITHEAPAESWTAYGHRVFNTHFKDAAHDPSHPNAMGDGWRYVPLGEGELPLGEAVRLLRDQGYHGYLTLEHEKRWHSELPEPEEMFPNALRWFSRQLSG